MKNGINKRVNYLLELLLGNYYCLVGKVAVNGICRYLLEWRKNIFLKLGWYRAYFASLHIDAGTFFVAKGIF
ncbi:hypothetical protein NCCP28_09840 [Niallia sp. NCCP-28]|nr:hypothetical protein NCCP28_09840 [Niallia sp. NCCP-28]